MIFTQSITNRAYTENGAESYKSSLSACLDLFSMGISSTNKKDLIIDAMLEDHILAIKTIMYLRDPRGQGQGNRKIARQFHKIAATLIKDDGFKECYIKLLPYLPDIGTWKDLYQLYDLFKDKDIKQSILSITSEALQNENSLALKWFPRQSQLHKDLADFWEQPIGFVRKYVAHYSNTVEQKMCNKEWSEIDYSSVPSKANLKYSEAFSRNDTDRRMRFIEQSVEGKSKINSSVLYPHEIISKLHSEEKVAEALWKNFPKIKSNINILPVIDVSSSMDCKAYSKYSCMDIAIALGMYFAENNTGSYKNLYCTFSEEPTFEYIKGRTLKEKVYNIKDSNWGGSTNLQAVFDTLIDHSLKYQESDIPKAVVIVSDMEFNDACTRKTNYEVIDRKYKQAGLEKPILIFWRVDTKLRQQPIIFDTNGTILINGYSPSIMKTVLNLDIEELKNISPVELYLKAINEEKYSFVDSIFKEAQ